MTKHELKRVSKKPRYKLGTKYTEYVGVYPVVATTYVYVHKVKG